MFFYKRTERKKKKKKRRKKEKRIVDDFFKPKNWPPLGGQSPIRKYFTKRDATFATIKLGTHNMDTSRHRRDAIHGSVEAESL